MKKNDKDDIDSGGGSLCTVKYSPIPEYIACPNCGLKIEFWSAADMTTCFFCGQIIFLCEQTVH
jgi:hypothetical protein